MKLFEGKSPAERNKLIAAMVLGALALLVVGYNFYGLVFGGKPKTTTTAKSSPSPSPSGSPNENTQVLEPIPAVEDVNAEYQVSPVLYNPLSFLAPIGSRNIFAFYEPPPPTPNEPTPEIIRTPTPEKPTPTLPPPPQPNVYVGFLSPQTVYAGSKGFKFELNGDKFTPDTVIFYNGMQLPTTFVNAQKLTTDISANMIAGAGSVVIEVRSLDGSLFSNQMQFMIQQPPLPEFQYVGLIARQRANNDTAYLLAKGGKEPIGARLNDTVGGRFRVISISNQEIILEDKSLGFKYKLPLYRIGSSGTGSKSGSSSSGGGQQFPNPGFPTNPQIGPNGQPCPPGIPCNPTQPFIPQNNQKKQEEDEDDEDGY